MGWTLGKALLFGEGWEASLTDKRSSQFSPAENLLLSAVPKPDKWVNRVILTYT